jgi:hypothetical protein
MPREAHINSDAMRAREFLTAHRLPPDQLQLTQREWLLHQLGALLELARKAAAESVRKPKRLKWTWPKPRRPKTIKPRRRKPRSGLIAPTPTKVLADPGRSQRRLAALRNLT